MGIANDMKNLGEDIVASYNTRVKAIGTIVKDTHNMLKGFNAEHKEMSEKLRADLAKGEEDRIKAHKALMADIKKFVSDVAKEVSNMIKRFQKEHKDMADQLRADLAKGEEDRIKAFKPMMARIQKEIKDIEAYVAKKLKEFSDAHAEMSKELKKELATYVDDMVKATKKLMGDIQARQKERNVDVADLLEAFKAEREKMAAHWQALTAKMAKKRGVEPIKVEAGAEVKTVKEAIKEVAEEEMPPEVEVKVRPVEEAIEEVAIKPKVEAEVKVRPVEEAIEEVAEEEMPPEMDLEERVLEFINRHPKGVTVGDMEEPLGVVRSRLGVIAKKLLNKGKVKKEENIYFPL